MDTDSKNNDNQKSWDELVSQARQSGPPGDLDILSNVRRAIEAEPAEAPATTGWMDELTELLDVVWLKPALATVTAAALLISWEAAGAWAEMSFALDLQLPMLTNIL